MVSMNKWVEVESVSAAHKCRECGKMIKKGEPAVKLITPGFKPSYYHRGHEWRIK